MMRTFGLRRRSPKRHDATPLRRGALREHALHHQPRRPSARRSGSGPVIEVAVGDVVVGEEVARRVVLCPRTARPPARSADLGVERRDGDAELVDLLVGDGGEPTALDEQLARRRAGLQQAERTVADAAEDAAGRVGLADLAAEHLRLPEVERRAPAAGEVDDVVGGEVDVGDRQRAASACSRNAASPSSRSSSGVRIVRLHRQRIDRDRSPPTRAGDVHLHARRRGTRSTERSARTRRRRSRRRCRARRDWWRCRARACRACRARPHRGPSDARRTSAAGAGWRASGPTAEQHRRRDGHGVGTAHRRRRRPAHDDGAGRGQLGGTPRLARASGHRPGMAWRSPGFGLLTILALVEFVTDQLPSTPSRTVPAAVRRAAGQRRPLAARRSDWPRTRPSPACWQASSAPSLARSADARPAVPWPRLRQRSPGGVHRGRRRRQSRRC